MRRSFIKINILLILAALILGSCKENNGGIFVDINQRNNVYFSDFFDCIDLIPLETNSESLIKLIDKVIDYQQRFYILDRQLACLFIFDSDGHFLNKINNRGGGPNEYINISDFELDYKREKVLLLSSVDRTLHIYDLDGNFEEKRNLPNIKGEYGTCRFLSDDILVFWTSDRENRLKFYSLASNQITSECFPEEDNNYNIFLRTRFPYKNFLARSSQNQLYHMYECGTVSKSYCWDFGRYNNNLKKMRKAPEFMSQLEMSDFIRKVYDSEVVNYMFTLHGGNSRYIYTQLYRHNKPINIFYDRKSQESIVFEKSAEGAYIYPFLWGEDYLIGIPDWQYSLDETVPDVLLDSIAIRKKQNITDSDNPVLIKYFFRNEK